MSFFEPPPEREVREQPVAEWWWAPRDELGEETALDQVIAESDKARVTLRSLVVYSNGFELRILGEWVEGALDVFMHTIVEPQSDQFLRLGVEFADGRRATNMDYANDDDDDADEDEDDTPPEKPFMGTGLPQHFNQVGHSEPGPLWVWGLPPEGDLFVVCEWPAVGVPVSRIAIDGNTVRAAAERSLKLWPDTDATGT